MGREDRLHAKKAKEKARGSSALEDGISLNVILSIMSILNGLLFISPRLTGNAIGTSWVSMNIMGIALIFLGTLGCFIWIRNKK